MELETTLRDAFVAAHPADTARVLELMPPSDITEVMTDAPVPVLAELLRHLRPLSAARSFELLTVDRVAELLCDMRRDAAAAILRAMETSHRAKVLAALPPEASKALGRLLRYAHGTAGALMDPRVLAMGTRATVADALRGLSESPQHALYYVYVLTDEHRLDGVVNIRELIGARREQLLGLVATRPVESLAPGASWESVAANEAWKRFHALPVTEADGRFLGVVRYESVLEFERQMGATPLDDQGTETAAALGELYGLGLRGILEWAASTLFGASDPDRGRR